MPRHAPPPKTRLAFPLLQFRARGDPPSVLMYVKYPLSLRNVEDLLHERGIDICHEGVVRFSPLARADACFRLCQAAAVAATQASFAALRKVRSVDRLMR